MSLPLRKNPFIESLLSAFPKLERPVLESAVSPELIASFPIEIPAHSFLKIENAVAAFHRFRGGLASGVCSSFDFHLDGEGQPKLIEINTNASFLFLSPFVYLAHGLKPWVTSEQIIEHFKHEHQLLSAGKKTELKKILIVDENPEQQKLYIEFLLAEQVFQSMKINCEISDFRALSEVPDFVYNRHTDFLLELPESAKLKQWWLDAQCSVSPNPKIYSEIADKKRLCDWALDPNLEADFRDVLLPCEIIRPENQTEIWSRRKKFFFKPTQSFGSKQSYRGESISRGAFDGLAKQQEFLAQQICPPPEIIFESPEGPLKFKYDLRVYFDQGKVLSIIARAYQGQLTNLRTLHGGFAPVTVAKT
jgi:hypothetical protein